MKPMYLSFFVIFFFTVSSFPAITHKEELEEWKDDAIQLNSIFTSHAEWNEFIETMIEKAIDHEDEEERKNLLWFASLFSLLKAYGKLRLLEELPDMKPYFRLQGWNLIRMFALPLMISFLQTFKFSELPAANMINQSNYAVVVSPINIVIANPNTQNPINLHLDQAPLQSQKLKLLMVIALLLSGYASLEGLISFYNNAKLSYSLKKHLAKPAGIRVINLLEEITTEPL